MIQKSIVFIDLEVSPETKKVLDYGAVDFYENHIHTKSSSEFYDFVGKYNFVAGHNIIDHDCKYLNISNDKVLIDTLWLSPLLFPNKPYHRLLKDDKILTDQLNNPLNDALKAMELFIDEVETFGKLESTIKNIWHALLGNSEYFSGFFKYVAFAPEFINLGMSIRKQFENKICSNADISPFLQSQSVELAYALAIISTSDKTSVTPRWVLNRLPQTGNIIKLLRNNSCGNCPYCLENLNPKIQLKRYFGYSDFRKYNGEPLQEMAAKAAIDGKSVLAIFPTGGGKSLTFQLPALVANETEHALTVVISPLQSLMKDQVDNLERRGILGAVTINGLLSPIERADAIERVENGTASMLYISPESLRSKTIERLLLSRQVARFVIDEAHCFSAWGQDFRVDYLYIGDYIRQLEQKKGNSERIPVSCFTATAKQKVVSDIKDYFKSHLNIDLELYATSAARTNLRYEVLYMETEEEKYTALRSLIEAKNCPTIVYVSRTKRTKMLAEKLTLDGYKALPFNGKMESNDKQRNQDAFINDEVQIIVATSAFGMGVDKSNIKLVVHFDISDSLENYVQEAGRAGRDQSLQAECYVLFNDDDLDKHFILNNQTKLSISEIQQIWKAVKDLSKTRTKFCSSALEIARQAGWDDNVNDIETRVRTALQALENAGYIKRGKNSPHIFASAILVKNMDEAGEKIANSKLFLSDKDRMNARRIINSLISSKYIAQAGNDDAESRVDYLSDRLGIMKEDVIHSINVMRHENILADAQDLSAYISVSDNENKSLNVLKKFINLENFMIRQLGDDGVVFNLKELNENAIKNGVATSNIKDIKTILHFWNIKNLIKTEFSQGSDCIIVYPLISVMQLFEYQNKMFDIARFVISDLYMRYNSQQTDKEEYLVLFSVLELLQKYNKQGDLFSKRETVIAEVEEALLYLAKINSMKLEGGFLVLYMGMNIERTKEMRLNYKKDDYKQLDEFYKQKIQQIHIVGEFANMMVKDYNQALKFVNDYFQMDYKKFLGQYFAGNRSNEISRNITPKKFDKLFKSLSERQLEIIKDSASSHIVIAAGPGSGKTHLLVHKLASILMLEDVKHEQLLMLTFSRAAALEFKKRLLALIGNAALFVEIKTFHSYSFDLLGKIGNLDNASNIVEEAARMIREDVVERTKITKTVLVIDEAQDMDISEFSLVEALMEKNDNMRVIAVGDDDQNIYAFRGSNSEYMKSLITKYNATFYELTDNYRSKQNIVRFANQFGRLISNRMKQTPIKSVSAENGVVALCRHKYPNFERAILNDIQNSNPDGSVCILTNTNLEALRIVALLKQNKIKAKLIESNDGFDLTQIMEMRYFLKNIKSVVKSPIISDDIWQDKKQAMTDKYLQAETLPIVLSMLTAFENAFPKKYLSDFEVFVRESKLEDFFMKEAGVITVSTIHKAKGMEFDNVIMYLSKVPCTNDDERHKFYVGITRAKSNLKIHYCDNPALDSLISDFVYFSDDLSQYLPLDKLMAQLTHKDVALDYFRQYKNDILSLVSGTVLQINGDYLYHDGNAIVRFSNRFKETIQKYKTLGYEPYTAKIRFIVAWRHEGESEDIAVVLPNVYFRKA